METPENLIFINVAPHDAYFHWQEEVLITNFRQMGISDKMHILIWYPEGSAMLSKWHELEAKYPEVKFFYYKDEGVNLGLYIPQLRPHTLKKHFKEHAEELKDKVFFYHDADILFRVLPDFNSLLQDNICWQSNCTHYLDYSYLHRKEQQGNIPDLDAIQELASIGRIPVSVIKHYDGKTGGAQTILRGIDASYWEDVERICIEIRKKFAYGQPDSYNSKYFKNESDGFQSWCADMWAVNFALWSRGIVTDVTDKLDFSWATDPMSTYFKKPIFHNAGASGGNPNVFYKGAWINRSPIGATLASDPQYASHMYVQAINAVK